jgi:transposase
MKAISPDLRHRIVAAYERGEGSQRQIAERFAVGEATVERLVRLKRETGTLDPKPHAGGWTPALTEADRPNLLAAFEREPDLRQQDLAERLTAEGRRISRSAVGRALKRLGITRKKRR